MTINRDINDMLHALDAETRPEGFGSLNQLLSSFQIDQKNLIALFEKHELVIWKYDFASETYEWSDHLRQLIGIKDDSLNDYELTSRLKEVIHPEDLDQYEHAEATRVKQGQFTGFQFRIINDRDQVRHLYCHGNIIKDQDNRPEYILAAFQDITSHMISAPGVSSNESRYEGYFNRTPSFIWLTDDQGIYVDVNQTVCNHFLKTRDELIGQPAGHLQTESTIQRIHELIQQTREQGHAFSEIQIMLPKVGHRWLALHTSLLPNNHIMAVGTDITELQSIRDALQSSKDTWHQVIESMPIMMLAFDENIVPVVWNAEAERVTGYSKQEMIGNSNAITLLYPDESYREYQAEYWREHGNNFKNWELIVRCKDGSDRIIAWSSVSDSTPVQGWFSWAVGVDVTERRNTSAALSTLNAKLEYDATHDELTDMPNKSFMMDKLTDILQEEPASTQARFAFLCLDLDDFKRINDSLGHHAGDQLLIQIASRLDAGLFDSIVARFTGDEFGIMITNPKNDSEVEQMVKRIGKLMDEPIKLEHLQTHIGVSIGIVMDDGHYKSPNTVLRDAETAMFQAKKEQLLYRFFDQRMLEEALKRFHLHSDIPTALRQWEFELHYQPIFRLRDHKLMGAEALVRWNHPQRGQLSPFYFIDAIEEVGLGVPFGSGVMKQAMMTAGQWLDRVDSDFYLSVNLSPSQVMAGNLIEIVRENLESTGYPARQLSLELLEHALPEFDPQIQDTLYQLKEMDIQLALDDFGAGYSSLTRLAKLPFEILKIDRAFLLESTKDPNYLALLRIIRQLADELKLKTIIEGIEDENTFQSMRMLGFDMSQGYLMGRPSTASDFIKFL